MEKKVMIRLCAKIVADTDLYETDREVQNLIDWVCLSEQIKENNNTIRNLTGEYKKIEPDCREGVRAQLERMKELCKERNSLYEKQNDLIGKKYKIEKYWNDKKSAVWRLLCPIFLWEMERESDIIKSVYMNLWRYFMGKWNQEAEKIMMERFGRDTIIALSTVKDDMPYVRYVNAYYENGAFYIITYALSNKMIHIENNSTVAIAGDWFTAHGKGVNLGYFGKKENVVIADKLKRVFAEWIDNGHNNFDDENTIILCVELIDGLLYSHGKKYEF